jgi:hypothetical protein
MTTLIKKVQRTSNGKGEESRLPLPFVLNHGAQCKDTADRKRHPQQLRSINHLVKRAI